MNIFGYSERGIVNSLFFEIAYSENADYLFHNLISLASFPFIESKLPFGTVKLMIEQSFSDFGDADAVALIANKDEKCCALFIEAKVKPFQVASWSISDEFDLFRIGLRRSVSSSNLFTQLYHKVRLVHALRDNGISALRRGVPFPSWSSKSLRKIGSNDVVLRAISLLEPFIAESFFMAIIPDSRDHVASFFESTLKTSEFDNVDLWDISCFGFLTWSDVKTYCERFQLARTLEVFQFNDGQIYAE